MLFIVYLDHLLELHVNFPDRPVELERAALVIIAGNSRAEVHADIEGFAGAEGGRDGAFGGDFGNLAAINAQHHFRWGTGALLGCGILALPLARRRRRFGLFLSLLALVGGMVACGGGGGGGGGSTVTGTPAGSYTVTITASSAGATAAAASLALTVD